ncbi:hypothetical protein FQN50_001700 [Emmonsiellopsis sp. PD_5]|nr:hypothetical protein FQN50_001700 [Emmonsiellopsis sp. PD_5]
MVLARVGLLLTALVAATGAVDIRVSSSGGNATSGHQYGFLHEDINNSGDGGIYAELIRNRAFQYSEQYPLSLDGWHAINRANLSLQRLSDPLSDALPVSMSVAPGTSKKGAIGFYNDGYWGMSVKKQKYSGSFWVKGSYKGVFTASLQSALTNETFGSVKVKSKASPKKWVEHKFELVPRKDAPNANNTFAITFNPDAAKGPLDFNLISLFPPTYKGRKNGLRVDLAEALAELHPDTLLPLKDRPGFPGVWEYQQTHGLGLMEYLYWAEDFDMEFVVGVYAGLSMDGSITPKDELQQFIDDALDEIEFIRGPPTSKWGSVRASLGHPEPFKLKYVEVGNEDWYAGDEGWATYKEYRFPMFREAINKAYPDIQVIASGSTTDGDGFDIPEGVLGDYHPYREPDALVEEFTRFDNDVGHIVGEVAATHPNGGTGWDGNLMPYPWWIGAVGEAISMIGYERNADRVPGTFYAPVLANLNRWQWAMFAAHPMSHTLPATATAKFGPLYYVAGKNEEKGTLIWKGAVYNTTAGTGEGDCVPVSLSFEGVKAGTKAILRVLQGNGDPYAYNDPFKGENIVQSTTVKIKANKSGAFEFELPELSIAVLETQRKRRHPKA